MLTSIHKQSAAKYINTPALRFLLAWAVKITVPVNRIGVGTVCLDSSSRILLLRHVFHPVTPWGLPGGWLNQGEDPRECALRELAEETGLSAELGPPIYVSREPSPDHIGIAFLARVKPEQMTLSSEIIEGRWFDEHEFPEAMPSFARKAIRAALAAGTSRSLPEDYNYE